MNKKRISTNNILQVIVLVLLLVAVAIRGGANLKWLFTQAEEEIPAYTLIDIKKIYPNANSFSVNRNNVIEVKDNTEKIIAELICSSDFGVKHNGYAGEVPVLIEFKDLKSISAVHLLPNNEAEDYIQQIKNKNLLQAWNGYMISDSTSLLNVDGISGATYSSNAIIRNVIDTVASFKSEESNFAEITFSTVFRIFLTIVLIILSLYMFLGGKFKKYYIYYSILVLLVFGIWLKQMFSMGLFYNWLTKGVSLTNNLELIAILILSISMALLGKRRYYCNYICPMGALQLLINKISPFKKYSFVNFKISGFTLKMIYLSFIGISLVLGFTLPLFEMEPFYAFSFSVASNIMLLAGVLIVVLSLFFNRPWCNLCPTGCLLDIVPSITTKNEK